MRLPLSRDSMAMRTRRAFACTAKKSCLFWFLKLVLLLESIACALGLTAIPEKQAGLTTPLPHVQTYLTQKVVSTLLLESTVRLGSLLKSLLRQAQDLPAWAVGNVRLRTTSSL